MTIESRYVRMEYRNFIREVEIVAVKLLRSDFKIRKPFKKLQELLNSSELTETSLSLTQKARFNNWCNQYAEDVLWDVENDECWIRDINSDGWETRDELLLGFTRLFLDKEWSNELGTTFDESTFENYVRTRYGVSTIDELSGDDKVKLFEWLRVAFNDMKANMEQILQNMRSGRNELKNFLDNELKSFVEQRMKFVYELMFAEMVDMAITIDENALRDNPYLCNGNFEKWYDEQMQKDDDFVNEFIFKLGKVYRLYDECW